MNNTTIVFVNLSGRKVTVNKQSVQYLKMGVFKHCTLVKSVACCTLRVKSLCKTNAETSFFAETQPNIARGRKRTCYLLNLLFNRL